MTQEFDKLFQKYKKTNDKSKIEIGFRMGKYHMDRENWDLAIETFNMVREEHLWDAADLKIKASLLKSLAVAMTKPNRESYMKYLDGRHILEEALQLDPNNSDTLATLGGTWKNIDDAKAYDCYKRALEIDEKDPYPLVNVVIYELKFINDFNFEKKRKIQILEAIATRKKQTLANKEIPWAYFDLGTFYLIRGVFKKAFHYYLIALLHCKSEWTIKTTLETLDLIKNIHYKKPYIILVRILLLLGISFYLIKDLKKNESKIKQIVRELKNLGFKDIMDYNYIFESPITIISGAFNQNNGIQFIENLNQIFKNTKGSIICSSYSYDFQKEFFKLFQENSHIKCFFYGLDDKFLKEKHINMSNIFLMNLDSSIFIDNFKDKLITFQYWFNVFQYWFNIFRSEIDPRTVKLIGFNGVKHSSIEYYIALAFGAQVGIIKGSGEQLLKDKKYNDLIKNIKIIDNKKKDIEIFLKN